MLTDARGLPVTSSSPQAAAHLDAAIDSYLGFRTDVGDHLKLALAADPQCPLALCARGYFMLLFARRDLAAKAREALDAAGKSIRRAANNREINHIIALGAWCDGDVESALRRWNAMLAEHPRDVLALKLAHYWHFYLGDAAGMRDSVAQVLPSWGETVPGHGYVLGLQAFGLEESGDYEAAERIGRLAVALNPRDAWAIHAVAHVLEMQDRPAEGAKWLDGLLPGLAGCNNFRHHVWWHRALFHIESGATDRALAIHDREMRAEPADYLDICNAVALLWRLEEQGVDVGPRWGEIARLAAARAEDHMLVFADAHYALALGSTRDTAGAGRLIKSARTAAATIGETEAAVLAEIGIPLCEAMLAIRDGAPGRAVDLLLSIRPALVRIGGSHAQRDLFEKMLVAAAMADGRRDLARTLLDERLQRRPRNAWGLAARARLAA